MKSHYIAIVTEKNSSLFGQVIGNTKCGTFKGMDLKTFTKSIGNSNVFSFEVKEVENKLSLLKRDARCLS